MKNITLFLFFCLTVGGLTSCIEDISITTPRNEGPTVEENDPIGDQHNFRIGATDVQIDFAYLQTTPLPDGETYAHHLVLSGSDVLQNGDLSKNDRTPAVAASFTSSSASPLGTYLLRTDGSAESGTLSVGGSTSFNFALDEASLATAFYSQGELTITEAGDEFIVTFDFGRQSDSPFFKLLGNYEGALQRIVLPSDEVSDEEFTGENFMRREQEEWPVTNAYLVKYATHYRLFLSDRPVHEAEELTGISNVMLFMLEGQAGNQISTGRYQIGRSGGQQGYFQQLKAQHFANSYFCRNMDFDLNSAGDDEVMDTGETLVQINDDQFKVKFDFVSGRQGHLEGEFQGTILEAGQ